MKKEFNFRSALLRPRNLLICKCANLLIFTLANLLIFIGCSKKDDPDTTAPKLPDTAALSVTNVTTEAATLSWTAATDDRTAAENLAYQVLWQAKESSEAQTSEAKAAMLTYTLTGLTEKTTYVVKVTVTDEAGNRAEYEAKEFTTPAKEVKPEPKPEPKPNPEPEPEPKPEPKDTEAPADFTITATKIELKKVSLSWTPATDNRTPQEKIHYRVQLFQNKKNGVLIDQKEFTGTTNCEFTPLSPNANYLIRIQAKDEAGNTKNAELKFTTPADEVAPSAVTITVENVGYENIAISWTPATDNATPDQKIRYKVHWADTNGIHASNFLTNVTTYEIKDLSWNTDYEVCVEAYDQAGNKSEVCKTIRTLKDNEAPRFKSVAAINVQKTSARIVWEITDNLTPLKDIRYKISWTDSKTGVQQQTFTGFTYYQLSELKPTTLYTVLIEAEDASGNKTLPKKVEFTTNYDASNPDPYSPDPGANITDIHFKATYVQTPEFLDGIITYRIDKDKKGNKDYYYFTFAFRDKYYSQRDVLSIRIHRKDFGKTIDLSRIQSSRDYQGYWDILYTSNGTTLLGISGDPKYGDPTSFASGTLRVNGSEGKGFSIKIENAVTRESNYTLKVNYKGNPSKTGN